MSDRRLVYVTTSTTDEATTIARAVVSEHLAACANVVPGMTSVYFWQGKLEEYSPHRFQRGRALQPTSWPQRLRACWPPGSSKAPA